MNASNDRLGVKLGHSAMSAQCPHCPKADVDPRIVMSQKCQEPTYVLEPIREVSIHDEELATRRLSMMRIMARWMKAATVLA